MYCIECGQAQPVQDARFCPFCGTALYRPSLLPDSPSPQGEPLQPLAVEAPGPSGEAAPAAALVSEPAGPAATPDPLSFPMALTLDPARWVPLKDRADQLRARLRWAIGLAVVLALVLGGAAAWWWASSEEPPPTDEAIEVERIEAEGAAPSSKPSPPPQPPQPKK